MYNQNTPWQEDDKRSDTAAENDTRELKEIPLEAKPETETAGLDFYEEDVDEGISGVMDESLYNESARPGETTKAQDQLKEKKVEDSAQQEEKI